MEPANSERLPSPRPTCFPVLLLEVGYGYAEVVESIGGLLSFEENDVDQYVMIDDDLNGWTWTFEQPGGGFRPMGRLTDAALADYAATIARYHKLAPPDGATPAEALREIVRLVSSAKG